MSIGLRTFVLSIGIVIGMSPAFARDDGQGGDLPCSALCQSWMDLGKGRATEPPPVAAVAPPSTVPLLSPKRPPELQLKPRLVDTTRHVPAKSPPQVARVVPLPVPRPSAPIPATLVPPEQPIAQQSADLAVSPVAAPISKSEPVMRAADPEPLAAQPTSPPEPIVASPPISLVIPTSSVDTRPAAAPAPSGRPVTSGHSTPLRIKLSVWIAIALLVGWFFAVGGPSNSSDTDHRAQARPRQRSGRRTAVLKAA